MRLTKILSNLFPALLLGLAFFISFKNFIPGTWLSGWDNLHPEFNLWLNIQRSLSAVWQEYQGLGLLGGMGHASDLPRQLILALFSIVVPTHLLRYLWVFLMLALGPLGVYFLAKRVISLNRGILASFIAFVAGAFYLRNLATVQYFYTPYEAFVSFYGFVPWLIFAAIDFLKDGGKKKLLTFFGISIISTPAFYVQTLFVVYIAILFVFVFEYVLRNKTLGIKRSLNLLLAVGAANAFWILPVLYFSLSGSGVLEASKINTFATPETQLMNADFGALKDTSLLKGFWFNYLDLSQAGRFEFLMPVWRDHLSEFGVMLAGWVIFVASFIGVLISIFRKTLLWRFSFLAVFLLCLFMLASINPPFGFIFSFLGERLPLFGQMFRSVFTKWSGPAALIYSLGLALLLDGLWGFLRVYKKTAAALVGVSILGLTLIPVFPVFEGELIMKQGRIEIPSSYFNLFKFFDSQPSQARVAFYPIQTFWGWNFYDWGARGSGFLWYGIKQPIVDRAFDVWSSYNESFYHELTRAVYGKDREAVKSVLDKYDINYVLIDKSVTIPLQGKEILMVPEMEEMLAGLGAKLVWEEDFLKVYGLERINGSGFVYAPASFLRVNQNVVLGREDVAFKNEGNYAAIPNSSFYPFSDLTREEVSGVSYQEQGGYSLVSLTRGLDGEGELRVPGISSGDKYSTLAKVTLLGNKLRVSFEQYPKLKIGQEQKALPILPDLVIGTGIIPDSSIVSLGGSVIRVNQGEESLAEVSFSVGEPIDLYLFGEEGKAFADIRQDFLESKINTCWVREGRQGLVEVNKENDIVSVTTKDAVGCTAIRLGTPSGKVALVNISLPFRSDSGARPHFCIVDQDDPQHKCLNTDVFYSTDSAREWTNVERTVLLSGNKTYWLELAARPSDIQGEEWQIDYRSPRVDFFTHLDSARYNGRVWEELQKPTSFTLDANARTLELSLVAPAQEVNLATAGKLSPDNCDLFERGSVEKTIGKGYVELIARDHSAVCDFAPLTTTSTAEGHLLRVVGQSISGRGLKTYVYNKATGKAELEVLAFGSKFDKSFSLLPWKKTEPGSYVLNVETRSFGKDIGQDRVERIAVYDIPLDWILNWKVEKGEAGKGENPIKVSRVSKFGTFFYRVKLRASDGPGPTGEGENEGLIVLSQGFDRGWMAFGGVEKFKHLAVNSWANGWIIPQGTGDVTIIFWPQYLEFIGLGLMLLGVIKILSVKEVDKREGDILQ